MIVLSLILVIVAAVTLLLGFFDADGSLTMIWISILACVLSIVTLSIGVMQRRRGQPEPTPPPVGYGPGAVGPKPAPAQLATVADEPTTRVIAKTSAREAVARAPDAERSADVEAAGDDAADSIVITPAVKRATKKTTRKRAAKKTARTSAKKSTARTATKKSTAKKATRKSTAKKATKKATKKSARKSTGKRAAKTSTSTTGAAARNILAQVQGVGPAKQDALLKAFKSIEAIRDASVDEIAALDGLGPTAAKKIKDAL